MTSDEFKRLFIEWKPKSPTPVRIYTWLRKNDVNPTTSELKDTFNISYSRMHQALRRAIEGRLVKRVYYDGKYYYGSASGCTNPIFYESSLHTPILPRKKTAEELLYESLMNIKNRKLKPKTCRRRIADWFVDLGWRIAKIVDPSSY